MGCATFQAARPARWIFACGDLRRGVRRAVPPVTREPEPGARRFPATVRAALWYKDQNPITAETERTR